MKISVMLSASLRFLGTTRVRCTRCTRGGYREVLGYLNPQNTVGQSLVQRLKYPWLNTPYPDFWGRPSTSGTSYAIWTSFDGRPQKSGYGVVWADFRGFRPKKVHFGEFKISSGRATKLINCAYFGMPTCPHFDDNTPKSCIQHAKVQQTRTPGTAAGKSYSIIQ